jgi:hypothetical protein
MHGKVGGDNDLLAYNTLELRFRNPLVSLEKPGWNIDLQGNHPGKPRELDFFQTPLQLH